MRECRRASAQAARTHREDALRVLCASALPFRLVPDSGDTLRAPAGGKHSPRSPLRATSAYSSLRARASASLRPSTLARTKTLHCFLAVSRCLSLTSSKLVPRKAFCHPSSKARAAS